eukprot:TRINITY_DN18731_c0_g1_i2.p1 TRINITY_DN18731_c0_g1~~TRINITY_DN18731_c0_g1_i2.p1  ORF type:complete len:378 (-),score=101.57 TRINITY_DN18731_c0_g1_i2:638-1771(-)
MGNKAPSSAMDPQPNGAGPEDRGRIPDTGFCGRSPPPAFSMPFIDTPLSHIDHTSCLGFDIGGTLTKVVFIERDTRGRAPEAVAAAENFSPPPLRDFIHGSREYGCGGRRHKDLEFTHTATGTTMNFITFETAQMDDAISLLRERNQAEELIGPEANITHVFATGGGAHKYKDEWAEQLGVELVPKDELGTVVAGISFMVQSVPQETYTLVQDEWTKHWKQVPASLNPKNLFPFLLCHIGSGVSIVKVLSPTDFVRVSGTALGGGTFYGLCRLTTGVQSFEEAMKLSETGDQRKVNLLVGDIYGKDLEIGGKVLPEDLTASFFGKNQGDGDPRTGRDGQKVEDSDVCQALCSMVAQNICQVGGGLGHGTGRLDRGTG